MTYPPHLLTLDRADLVTAAEAALAGGKVLLHYWETPPVEFRFKADSHFDLVSEVDENTDHAVQAVIKRDHPTDKILSEELCPELESEGTHGRLWIIDPLDGTSAFLFRADASAPSVMIALLVDGVTEVAMVYQPMIQQWTYAVRGSGAFVNGVKVSVTAANRSIKNAWVDMNHYGDLAYESPAFKSIDAVVRGPGGARLVSRMSPYSAVALRLLRNADQPEDVNQRGLSACVHDHNGVKPKQLSWDIAPIQLIITEAGGVYADSAKGVDAKVDPFDLRGPIVIGHRDIVADILHRL